MKRTSFPYRSQADAPRAVAAAAFIAGLNALVMNVQPIIMGALADGRGLDDARLGQVSAIFIGLNTLSIISAPLWLRAFNWRAVSLVSIFAAAGATLAAGVAITFPMILAAFALLGLLQGFSGAVAFASLGEASNPDRAFGASIVAQSLLAAVAATPLSAWIIPHFGVVGLFVTLAAACLAGAPACLLLPAEGVAAGSPSRAAAEAPLLSSAAIRPALGLLASALFVGGILGFWYYMDRIGVARGASSSFVGLAVSLCAIATIFTAALVTWLGGRLPSMVFVLGGTGAVLAGYALLLIPGDAAFMAAALLFAMGWGLAQPAYWSVIRKVDGTGRLFVAAPAASGVAGVVIGIVAGPVIKAGGYAGLVLFSAALMAVAAACLALSDQTLRRRSAVLAAG